MKRSILQRAAAWWVAEARHLVQRNDEGRPALLEKVDGFDGLRLQPVHEVHHQDGDVAQAAAA